MDTSLKFMKAAIKVIEVNHATLDLIKTFDKVSHLILFREILNSNVHNSTKNCPVIVRSLHENIYVECSIVTSRPHKIRISFPQGKVFTQSL